jgi:hypothetical protein
MGQITSPRDGSKVDFQQVMSGIVSGLPPGTDAWIVVYPVSAAAYWPQPGPLLLDPTGGFRTSAYFGANQAPASGETFIAYLVIAPQAASQRFRTFVAQPPQNGLPTLPSGVQTLAKITVTR